jgi:predicted dehydrogenase
VVDLIRAARQHQRVIMVCHVLRYAPLYRLIKQLLLEGRIGSIVAMHTSENVSYHHMAVAFIRGKWRRTEANPMLLAKCCHDLDIIAWMMQGNRAKRVASFGSLMQFKPENAPAGSALRCLDGCQIESTCPYSARANYITQGLWDQYAWRSIQHIPHPTVEDKLNSLRTDNPFGRCVWHCDNDVVDHQSVVIEYENGATVTHNMLCATARPTRTIHIVGTKGEIEGDWEAGMIKIRTPHTVPGQGYQEQIIASEDLSSAAKGHGGTDEKIVADFVGLIAGNPAAIGATRIEDSLAGHQLAFAADEALRGRCVVEIQQHDFTPAPSAESGKIPQPIA